MEKNVVINIDKLIGTLVIVTSEQDINDVKEKVKKALLEAVNEVEKG